MKLKRIKIKNFRSIRDETIYPGRITALLGPNNSGKTNILSAVNFLLGEKWPSTQILTDRDFFDNDRKNGLAVGVELHPNEKGIASIWFNYDHSESRQTGARYKSERTQSKHFLSNEVRNAFPVVYLDAERSFDKQFGTSQWSLWGQAIRQLNTNFRSVVSEDIQALAQSNLVAAQQILRTEMYESFVREVTEGFKDQVRKTSHSVDIDFRTFDPLNFYKTLQPVLIEEGVRSDPSHAGSGMRNLIVLALFRAYAKTFRGESIFAIEEPEIFLHPHAQRSLYLLFREMSGQGAQILYSTHSTAFVRAEAFDDIVVVDRKPDVDKEGDEKLCTSIRTLSVPDLILQIKKAIPALNPEESSLRDRLSHACMQEHSEAFFSKAIILVEGPTERAALPIYADALGLNLDQMCISVVSANGKNSLALLYNLYVGLGFPLYLIFDNDSGSKGSEKATNALLTRMLGVEEQDSPEACVSETFAILEGDFEKTTREDLRQSGILSYDSLVAAAKDLLGNSVGKPAIARYVARELVIHGEVPTTIKRIIEAACNLCKAKIIDTSTIGNACTPDNIETSEHLGDSPFEE